MIRTSMASASLKESALVLVGHGSAKNPGSGLSTRRHAESLAKRGIFGAVHAALLKEEPFLDGLLDRIEQPVVHVVPNMASKGYLTETLIPKALGLTGTITERITPKGHQRIYLHDPVGTHPALLDRAARNVADIVRAHASVPEATCILVAGHGNTANPENAAQTRRIANRIRKDAMASSVRCAFLEEPPYIKDWRHETDAATVIVLPFLISGGVHGGDDIPILMGIDTGDERLAALADGATAAGPFSVDGRRIFYLRPIGADPVVEDIAIALAQEDL